MSNDFVRYHEVQKMIHAGKQAGIKSNGQNKVYYTVQQNYPFRQSRNLSVLVYVLSSELCELGCCWAQTGKSTPFPKLEQK
jgi:hypothetical protein